MAVKVNQVELLKEYFFGVVERSEHHAPNVSEVIYPLLGLIVLKMDDKSDIQVRGSQGATGISCGLRRIHRSMLSVTSMMMTPLKFEKTVLKVTW